MQIDDRVLQAIQGITGLQTGEWTRDEVPDDVYASWVEALGPGMVEALLDLDRNEPEPTPHGGQSPSEPPVGPTGDNVAEPEWERVRDEMRGRFVRELGRDLSPKTDRVLRYIEGRAEWPLATRTAHYRHGLEHERVLRAAAGPGARPGRVEIDAFREPFAILYTAVRPGGPTRWRRTRVVPGGANGLRLTSASGHDAWIRDGAVRLEGDEVLVEGGLLPADELGVFVVSATGRYSEGGAEVFVLRRGADPGDNVGAEVLAERGLFVDAWRAMAAAPGASPDEVAEFLLLFVFDPMTRASRAVPATALRDRKVERCWGEIVDALDPIREALRDLFAPEDR